MTTDDRTFIEHMIIVEIEICEATGKRCFSSWWSADRHRIFVIRRGVDQRRAGEYLQSYACKHCGRRHVGHTPRSVSRRRPRPDGGYAVIRRDWWHGHDDDQAA
ncbi:MAG: hypothetical protein KGS47_06035 [Chloroflexi bacterium]|nr:hypothetical protein [Chloroflexota bacterium]